MAKFNFRKWRNLTLLLAGGMLLALSHQNCMPAGQSALHSGQPTYASGDDQIRTTIDDVNRDAAVGFAAKAVEVHTLANEVNLSGICSHEQEKSILGWKIRDAAGGTFARGMAACENGRFTVELAPAQELECDKPYVVTAQLGMAQAGEMRVLRRCAPQEVAAAPAMKLVLAARESSSCVRETTDSGCSVVCYDTNGIVEAKQEVDPKSCGI